MPQNNRPEEERADRLISMSPERLRQYLIENPTQLLFPNTTLYVDGDTPPRVTVRSGVSIPSIIDTNYWAEMSTYGGPIVERVAVSGDVDDIIPYEYSATKKEVTKKLSKSSTKNVVKALKTINKIIK